MARRWSLRSSSCSKACTFWSLTMLSRSPKQRQQLRHPFLAEQEWPGRQSVRKFSKYNFFLRKSKEICKADICLSKESACLIAPSRALRSKLTSALLDGGKHRPVDGGPSWCPKPNSPGLGDAFQPETRFPRLIRFNVIPNLEKVLPKVGMNP